MKESGQLWVEYELLKNKNFRDSGVVHEGEVIY